MKTYSVGIQLESQSSAPIRVVKVLIFALATALAAQIQIPVPGSVVPITLQTAIVLLAGLSLGAKDGAFSQAVYLVFGALGLPFFAGAAGAAVLFGPTGGYLFGFVLCAFILGALKNKFHPTSFFGTWAIALLSSLMIFVPGVIFLKFFMALSWQASLMTGVLPFIIGDLVKTTLAVMAYRAGKHLFF